MAKSRELKIIVAGDADKLDKEVRKANNSLDSLGKQTRLTASVTSKGFTAMRVGATGAAAAAAGLVIGMKSVTEAAIESEKSQARLQTQLKASGISYRAHAKEIDNVIQKTSQLAGLDDEDLQDAFTNIVRVTGNVSQSLRLTGLAADFARAKHIDVAKAGEIVGKVAGGNVGVLSRYGVVLGKNATTTEALGALQKKFAGQAAAYGRTTAGATDRAGVAFENLKETIGGKLAPVVADLSNKLARFINGMQDGTGAGGKFARAIAKIPPALQDAARWVKRAAGDVNDTLGPAFRFVAAVAQRAFPGIRALVLGLARTIKGVVNVISGIMHGDFRQAFGGMKDIVSGAVKAAAGALRAATAPFREAASRIGKAVVAGIVGAIKGAGSAIGDAVKSIVPGPVRGAVGAVTKLFRASGGIVPGSGRGDIVPAMLEPGEFIIQRKVVERFGPTFFAGINGGMGQPQARGFSAGGIVSRANAIDSKGYPYVWGGGHSRTGVPTGGGYDCSGAVSAILGVSPPRVSGGFTSWGSPGPGNPMDTKVFANAEHVFAVINGRGWGTSHENPGGGPGWLSYNYRPGFTIRHTSDGDSGNAGASVGDSQESVESGKQRKTAAQQKAGSRLANRIIGATSKAVNAATSRASAIGGVVEDADAGYSRSERFFGQVLGGVPGAFGDEDLGTATGRSQRTTELNALRDLKKQQLARLRKRMAALTKAVSGREKTLKSLRKARDRAKGAKRAKLTERLKSYEDRTIDLQAELKALGGAISDTQLDIGDLDKDIQDVAGTPDTAVDTPEAPSASDVLSSTLSDIDLQERAGLLTPEQAQAGRVSYLQRALSGEFGALDQRQTWEVMGQLRDVQQQAAQALTDNTAAIKELKDSIDAQTQFASSVAAVTSLQAVRALSDVISGQLGARVAQRSQLPGTGALARL